MTALVYLLGFLTGLAAALVILLIKRARRRTLSARDKLSHAYTEILNY